MHLAEVRRRLYSSTKKGAKAALSANIISPVCGRIARGLSRENTAQRARQYCTLAAPPQNRSPAHAGHAVSAQRR